MLSIVLNLTVKHKALVIFFKDKSELYIWKSVIDVEHHFLVYGTTIHLQNVSTGSDRNLKGR